MTNYLPKLREALRDELPSEAQICLLDPHAAFVQYDDTIFRLEPLAREDGDEWPDLAVTYGISQPEVDVILDSLPPETVATFVRGALYFAHTYDRIIHTHAKRQPAESSDQQRARADRDEGTI